MIGAVPEPRPGLRGVITPLADSQLHIAAARDPRPLLRAPHTPGQAQAGPPPRHALPPRPRHRTPQTTVPYHRGHGG